MQNYNFFNKSSGEIVTQKFKNPQQVEDFLQRNERFELVGEDLQNLPVRGTRQLSLKCLEIVRKMEITKIESGLRFLIIKGLLISFGLIFLAHFYYSDEII